MSDPATIAVLPNPKIPYCINKQKGISLKSAISCSNIQYKKLATGGNYPYISKKMLYAKAVSSGQGKSGYLCLQ